MKLRKLAKRALVVAAAGAFLLFCVFISAHWVDYEEHGCTHFGTRRYEERGVGFAIPFSGGKLHKTSVHERKYRTLKIETDFGQLPRFEAETDVTKLKVNSRLPIGFVWEQWSTHCSNFIARAYESNQDFQSALQNAVTNQIVSVADVAKATECCTLPYDDGTPGIKAILDLYHQTARREPSASVDSSEPAK